MKLRFIIGMMTSWLVFSQQRSCLHDTCKILYTSNLVESSLSSSSYCYLLERLWLDDRKSRQGSEITQMNLNYSVNTSEIDCFFTFSAWSALGSAFRFLEASGCAEVAVCGSIFPSESLASKSSSSSFAYSCTVLLKWGRCMRKITAVRGWNGRLLWEEIRPWFCLLDCYGFSLVGNQFCFYLKFQI